MNLLTRRPKTDQPHVDGQPGTEPSGQLDGELSSVAWTGPAAWVTKTITVLMLVAQVTGPVALLLVLALAAAPDTKSPVKQAAPDSAVADERAAVGAYASDYVTTWLTTTRGQEKRLEPFLSTYATASFPKTPWQVSNPAVAGITPPSGGKAAETPEGAWSVTISATVAENSQTAGVRRYFQAPIIRTEDGAMTAAALPALVPGPTQAVAPDLAYREQVPADDPVATAAAEFLTALLVGGDVTRYITPGAPILAVTPPPYTKVEVDKVQADEDPSDHNTTKPEDGDQLQLLVRAVATPTAETSAVSVQYVLTVTARAGRWEVSSLDPAPAVTAPDPGSLEPSAPSTGATAPTDSPS